jgi:hypothetical protein
MFAVGLCGTLSESPTSDEPAHIVGGYVHYTQGQPRIHTENGYLAQALAAFPLLFTRPHLDTSTDAFKHAEIFALGREFLYQSNRDAGRIVLLARAMIGLLSVITGLGVYAWSRFLFSRGAGMLSLLVFGFSPVVLAHGFLATSDMAATCFFLLTLGAFWLTLQRITPLRLLLSALFFGLLCVSKMSAPLILPALFLLAVVHVLERRPIPWQISRNLGGQVSSRVRKAAALSGVLLIHGLMAFIVIWGTCGFTYSAFKDSPAGSGETFSPPEGWRWAMESQGATLRAITFARDHHLLPEAYLYGYAHVARLSQQNKVFVNGSYGQAPWWFYPYMFLLTTPIAVLLLVVLAVMLGYRQLRGWYTGHPSAGDFAGRLRPLLPLLFFVGFYWLAVIPNPRSATGPRHLLPAYAPLCILVGACAAWNARRPVLKRGMLAVLSLWLIAEVGWVYPHTLSYFNEFVGGSSKGYRYLSDSSVDWGQDLPALAGYLQSHNPRQFPVYFSYFGDADLSYYGIRAHPLPSFFYVPNASQIQPLEPGLYCISTSMFGGAGSEMPAPPEALSRVITMQQFGHLLEYCKAREPIAQAGYSINIYELSASDLRAALAPPSASGSMEMGFGRRELNGRRKRATNGHK